MQNTPFSKIQHHQDGKHIFTVMVDDEKKMFATTSSIDAAKALRNALNWRNSKTGDMLLPSDEIRIERFIKELEQPATDNKPIKVISSKPTVPDHVKVQTLPSGVRRTTETVMRKTIKAGRPKIADTEREQHILTRCKSAAKTTNSRRPGLPQGVSIIKLADGTVNFGVDYYNEKGKLTARSFRVGKPDVFSLAKYRLMRHIAICFRKEYLNSIIENRPMDWEAFESPRQKVKQGTFPWPFTGTLPNEPTSTERTRRHRSREEFQIQRIAKSMDATKGLPVGVKVNHICRRDKTRPEYHMQVSYTLNGKAKMKSFYLCLEGNLKLSRYRLIRHLALSFRKEFVMSRIQKREPNFDLFNDWKANLDLLLEIYPYKWSVPTLDRVQTKVSLPVKLATRSGVVAKDIFQYLAGQSEFAPVLSAMPAERADELLASMSDLISAELYKSQRKP